MENKSKHILVAGGTGLIGKKLVETLQEKGYTVDVLTRYPKASNQYFWDPTSRKIDFPHLESVTTLINLSGAGIADKRWTEARKEELSSSRIGTNEFLFSLADRMPNLAQFICSSGINCYNLNEKDHEHIEADPFGTDYLSTLVRDWEKSADIFTDKCKVAKIRTAVVIDKNGGALKKMIVPIKMGIGSPLGTGEQMMPWIHADDLTNIFIHCIDHELEGVFNASAGSVSNREFIAEIAKQLNKPFWFPSVPSFVLKIILGEMSSMLLTGISASNAKIKASGFEFKFPKLSEAIKSILN